MECGEELCDVENAAPADGENEIGGEGAGRGAQDFAARGGGLGRDSGGDLDRDALGAECGGENLGVGSDGGRSQEKNSAMAVARERGDGGCRATGAKVHTRRLQERERRKRGKHGQTWATGLRRKVS